MNAFVSIYFERQSNSTPTTILNRISRVTNVKFVNLVTGDMSAIAWVETPDPEAFRNVVLDINSVNGVDYTYTFYAL